MHPSKPSFVASKRKIWLGEYTLQLQLQKNKEKKKKHVCNVENKHRKTMAGKVADLNAMAFNESEYQASTSR